MTPSTTEQQLRTWLAECMDLTVDQLPPADEDLVDHGLHSVAIMQFAGRYQRAGIDIETGQLAAEPTIDAWLLLVARSPAPASPDPGRAPLGPRSSPDRGAGTTRENDTNVQ